MKKTKMIIVMVTLMLVAVGSYFVAGTYAKYTSQVEGNAIVSVAKWSFAEDNAVTNVDIALEDTVDASTLVAGKIAPGTSGAFGINVNSANTEVGVDFSVNVTAVGNMPANLLLYASRTCPAEGEAGDCVYADPITVNQDNTLNPVITKDGTLTAQDAVGLNVEVYWVWAYETGADAELTANDVADTTDGTEATDFTFTVAITGVQVPPSATPITSAFDVVVGP